MVVGPGSQFDRGGDHLAEPVVDEPHRDGVAHGGVEFEHFLDLFGEDLLPAGVDDHRASAQQMDRPVGLHRWRGHRGSNSARRR